MEKIINQWGTDSIENQKKILFSRGKNLKTLPEGEHTFECAMAFVRDNPSTGEATEFMKLLIDGEVYSTISQTFMEEFIKIATWSESNKLDFSAFKLKVGKSSKGREFLQCEPV